MRKESDDLGRVLLLAPGASRRERIARMLRGRGYGVDIALHELDAVRMLEALPYDLVVVEADAKRAQIDACARTIAPAPKRPVPVIVMTTPAAGRSMRSSNARR
jgi:CheY-like chemotaxis protein